MPLGDSRVWVPGGCTKGTRWTKGWAGEANTWAPGWEGLRLFPTQAVQARESSGSSAGGDGGSQLGGLGWGCVAWQPHVSLSQPRGVGSCQLEVENWHIEEVTDSFALVQVVDVIVVSRGWREAEERGEHF